MIKPPLKYSSGKDEAAATQKIVYLMRGLPSSGKSHSAQRLAAENGVVCETDAYFYSEVGADPDSFDYDASLLAPARKWNLKRHQKEPGNGPPARR